MTIPLWGLMFIIVGSYILLTKKKLDDAFKIIGIFGFFLFIVSFSFFLIDGFKDNHQQNQNVTFPNKMDRVSLDSVNSILGYVPDLYYIVPDGYANSNVLEEYFGYDNRLLS